MSDTESPIQWSASEIGRRIGRREISTREVTRAFVARIQQVNPKLNAVVIPRFEEAVKEAAAADEKQSRGETLGPLDGGPITAEECFPRAVRRAVYRAGMS